MPPTQRYSPPKVKQLLVIYGKVAMLNPQQISGLFLAVFIHLLATAWGMGGWWPPGLFSWQALKERPGAIIWGPGSAFLKIQPGSWGYKQPETVSLTHPKQKQTNKSNNNNKTLHTSTCEESETKNIKNNKTTIHAGCDSTCLQSCWGRRITSLRPV